MISERMRYCINAAWGMFYRLKIYPIDSGEIGFYSLQP